jgi:MFS family permease
LDNSEKQDLTNLLRDDADIPNGENAQVSWRQVFYVFIDWRIYLYALISIGILGVVKYINTYLPLLVEDMGNSEATVHLMTAPPYLFAFVCCLLTSYSSSRKNEHGFHLMFCLSIALVGFILMLTLIDQGKTVLYVGISIACCGIFSAYPISISWLTNNVGGHTKRSIAIGFVVGIGQIGGVILPFVRLLLLLLRIHNYFSFFLGKL